MPATPHPPHSPTRFDTARFVDLTGLRRVLHVRGSDARDFLHRMVTQDIAAMAPGETRPSCLLAVKGQIQAEFWVHCEADNHFWLYVPTACADALATQLDRYIIADDVTLEAAPQGTAIGVIAGPADAVRQAALEATGLFIGPPGTFVTHGPVSVAHRALTGAEAFPEILITVAAEAVADSPELSHLRTLAASLDDYEALRVARGIPAFGMDFGPDDLLPETGLAHHLSFNKGCYVGQEPIARIYARGGVHRQLALLTAPWPAESPLPPAGTELHHAAREGKAAGTLKSVARTPNGAAAIASIRVEVAKRGTSLTLLSNHSASLAAWLVEAPVGHPEKFSMRGQP
jgi:tRNA-modifying protein YgfZ